LELAPKAFGEAAEEHKKTSIDTVAVRLAGTSGDTFFLGAFLDGRLVGTVGFWRNETIKRRHKGRVRGMYVAPVARGRGAGRALMSALIERVRAIEGIEEIVLSVTSSQPAAKKLYLSLGFEPFGCERDALRISDEFVDEDYMTLRLRRQKTAP
jgi:RimJ/RimL family protein N-acetyltransferase